MNASASHRHQRASAAAPALMYAERSLFEPGRNCWRVEPATRVAFLIDGDAYFKAFVAAARTAQRSILILGWDFHSRTRLLCDEHEQCLELGDFLNELTRQRPQLHVHILTWDYPMIFGLDRDWAPIIGLGWKPARRVTLHYDNTHPVGGSHHQKVVVIDDAMAFCGGIDLTCRRWDTCEHAAVEARRIAQDDHYPPFHDLMMAVEGRAAGALGELVRERWQRATGQVLPPAHAAQRPFWRARERLPDREAQARWPAAVPVHLTDVEVAIARTAPPGEHGPGIHEVESSYLDMIAAARQRIYIENQYFTCDKLGAALAQRLAEPDGPEVILVLRQLSHGWLEELTMQTLRTRLLKQLHAADRYGRFRVFYPYIDGLEPGTCIDVHSKLIIVDETLARIGSANLANRSMGLDTECDLTIEAKGSAAIAAQIEQLRSRLLGEHLGVPAERVSAAVAERGSLRAAIAQLQNPRRTLKPLEDTAEVSEALLNVVSVADPERPVALNDLVKLFSPRLETAAPSKSRWRRLLLGVLVIAGLTALWHFTPLRGLLEPERIDQWAELFGGKLWAPLVVLIAYTPACIVMFPRSVITLFAVLAFGPWLGFLYAMLGVELAAWLTYVAGRRLRRDTVRRLAGPKLNRIIEVLRRRGLLAMTALRLVPLAPFAVEGLVAGAVHIKLWQFMLGTAIGILPGTLAATVFGDQLQRALEHQGTVDYWLIVAAVLFVVITTWWVRRWLLASSEALHPEPLERTQGDRTHGDRIGNS
jgi:phospholipase D1/2